MSGRQDKKMRQYYRRDMRERAREIGEMIANNLKPKPAWISTQLAIDKIKAGGAGIWVCQQKLNIF